MLKVAKFGGSSMADAGQYQKIRDIIRSDPSRRVVVVSAAGKRSAGDNKITDLLYLCYAHLQYGVSCDGIYQMIRERYGDIHRELGLRVDLEGVLDRLRSQMEQGISRDELGLGAASTFPRCLWPITSALRSWTPRSGCSSTMTAPSIRRNPMPRCARWPGTSASSFRASMA